MTVLLRSRRFTWRHGRQKSTDNLSSNFPNNRLFNLERRNRNAHLTTGLSSFFLQFSDKITRHFIVRVSWVTEKSQPSCGQHQRTCSAGHPSTRIRLRDLVEHNPDNDSTKNNHHSHGTNMIRTSLKLLHTTDCKD